MQHTMASGADRTAHKVVSDLRETLNGHVITPAHVGYEQARTLFYGGFDHRPAAIVRPTGVGDVARVVRLASEAGLELAVRSGGHSSVGHSTSDGGVVIDLSAMKALTIDPVGRTAWAEAGLRAGEYTAAVGAHGLATGFGDTASVGVGGITLGGGVGFLVRRHGLTIDSVLAAEVVTADGQIRRADPKTHPDLFWAIRGGGGNFGIATRLRYRLHAVDTVVGGTLVLPATPEVIAGFVAEADAAPEDLSTIANIMPAPPLPFVPDGQHGQLVVMAQLAYAGHATEGQTGHRSLPCARRTARGWRTDDAVPTHLPARRQWVPSDRRGPDHVRRSRRPRNRRADARACRSLRCADAGGAGSCARWRGCAGAS
jgi:FAD/FMN-containing dehydrogenase